MVIAITMLKKHRVCHYVLFNDDGDYGMIITIMIDCHVDYNDHSYYHHHYDCPGQSEYQEREKMMILIMISLITIILNRLPPSYGKE